MNLDTASAMKNMGLPTPVNGEQLIELTQPKKRGRQIDPATLAAYQQIRLVYNERPNDFSKKELCEKHGVTYINFINWLKNQEGKKQQPKRMRPDLIEKPIIVGQSFVACSIDDLIDSIVPHIRETVKIAILDGVKNNKIKVLRP